jgi:hypothetical protein
VRYSEAADWVEQALSLPRADDHPRLRITALCTKAGCLWPTGHGAERAAVMAEAEAIARRLDDPLTLSQTLQVRVFHEMQAERLDVAEALADEAIRLATAAGDEWEIAEASVGRAVAASTVADLRERVGEAASRLTAVGNLHGEASLLTDAAYA